jgi:tetratricopeptide (TPR) repeat protein
MVIIALLIKLSLLLSKATIVNTHIKHITNNTETKKDTSNLSDLYLKISKYEGYINQNFKEALLTAKFCLDIRKKLFKGDHDSVASGLNNISLIYQDLGEYEKALKYAQDELDMTMRLFKGDHDSIATGLNNISLIYEDLGEYEKASKYAQDSLDITMRLFKGDHPLIKIVKSNIQQIAKKLNSVKNNSF